MTKYLYYLIVFGVGMGLGFSLIPKPVKVVTEIKTVEVEKKVELKNNNVETQTTKVTKPDGTVEEKTVTVDKSTTKERTDILQKSDTSKTEIYRSKWKYNLFFTPIDDFKFNPNINKFGLGVEYDLGGLFLGVNIHADKRAGLSLGVQF